MRERKTANWAALWSDQSRGAKGAPSRALHNSSNPFLNVGLCREFVSDPSSDTTKTQTTTDPKTTSSHDSHKPPIVYSLFGFPKSVQSSISRTVELARVQVSALTATLIFFRVPSPRHKSMTRSRACRIRGAQLEDEARRKTTKIMTIRQPPGNATTKTMTI